MTIRILTGDCRTTLADLPERSVQTCVTSPPYFGLRDYGHGAQIGLEATPDAYVAELVAVFRAVRRVLRDDGTLWLNLGDSYAANVSGGLGGSGLSKGGQQTPYNRAAGARPRGEAKPKDLLGIPWRVAFALQADGWWLRSDIVWHKPNPMPESVTDRPTKAHEYVFLLTKAERYLYDADAIAESAATPVGAGSGNVARKIAGEHANGRLATHVGSSVPWQSAGGRNARTVWTIATQPYGGAHFATMPPALAERCIRAGTSPQACETCGAPWRRQTAVVGQERQKWGRSDAAQDARLAAQGGGRTAAGLREGLVNVRETTGWAPTCACATNTGAGRCVVLDPFGGAGTTGLVADRLGRDAVLCEINPEYAVLAESRIRGDNPLFAEVAS